MASIQVLEATPDDARALAEVEASASSCDPVGEIMFGPTTPEGIQHRAEEMKLAMTKDPASRLFKAVIVEPGRDPVVAGASHWFVRDADWMETRNPDVKGTLCDVNVPEDWGPTANAGACNAFFGALYDMRKRRMGGTRHAVLATLMTRPEYQRRGVGTALLNHAFNLSGLQDRPLWLEASPMGYPLYKKLGFEDVEEKNTDFTPYGREYKAKHVGMLKKAGIPNGVVSNSTA